MPRGDRTGPMGAGPMTGRRMGLCSGNDVPGYASVGPGRGSFRGGPGGGRGWRHWFHATVLPGWMRYGGWWGQAPQPDPELEKVELKSRTRALETELKEIQKRIEEIESGPGAE